MNRKRSILTLTVVVLFIANLPRAVHAELAQSYYATLQYFAPEILTIRVYQTVVTRTKDGNDSICEVRAKVEIVSVTKSSSMLRVGNCIVIEYTTVERRIPIVGPSPVPLLEVGKIYPAYLTGTDLKCVFEPAARGYSFQRVDAEPDLPEKK